MRSVSRPPCDACADLTRRLAEARATIDALVSGQVDAVVDPRTQTPVMLAKAQEALRESEERYRLIVEATSDGIIQIDQADRIVFVNRRLCQILGYEPEELVGASVHTLVGAPERAAVVDSIESRRRGEPGDFDATYRHKDGQEVSVHVAGVPLLDEHGVYVGSLGMVRDVTEKNRLRSQLMVSDRMASAGTLAAGVAHEINNPLAAVLTNLDYLGESVRCMRGGAGGPDPVHIGDAWIDRELASPLADAREAAARVRSIVRDLKVFSHSPAEEVHGPVDVKATMESSLRMAWNEIRHRAQLVKHFGSVPPVRANEARLSQVFLNLIVNAAQAIPEGRAERNEIRVTTRLEGERVVVEVSDTGPGIPPEIIGRIFDAFFTTKPVGAGTGLGLAISHRIVTDMGGELTVVSEVGKGATFRVALPIASADDRSAPEKVLTVPVQGRRARILVVDDEKILVRAVERMLVKQHDVVGSSSGGEALARITAGETFDLILCDLMMPEMSGMDLHRELSSVAPAQANRMLFMTGGAFTPRAREFLSDPPKEHIEKPFDPANLRAIVQRYVQMAA